MAGEGVLVLVAYDGSELSKAALRQAALLFPGHRTVLATVWEPGLAAMSVGAPGSFGPGTITDPETIEAVDRAARDHASTVAEEGAELARSLGLGAEPHAVPDEVDVADTLIDLARGRGAALVIVGSHGISGLRARVLGSVARKLIERCDRPVLVVRDQDR